MWSRRQPKERVGKKQKLWKKRQRNPQRSNVATHPGLTRATWWLGRVYLWKTMPTTKVRMHLVYSLKTWGKPSQDDECSSERRTYGTLYYRIPEASLQSINQATESAGPHLTMHGRVAPAPMEPPPSELSADGGRDHHGSCLNLPDYLYEPGMSGLETDEVSGD